MLRDAFHERFRTVCQHLSIAPWLHLETSGAADDHERGNHPTTFIPRAPKPPSEDNEPHPGTGVPVSKPVNTHWAKLSMGIRAANAFMQAVVPEDGVEKRATTSTGGLELDKSGDETVGAQVGHEEIKSVLSLSPGLGSWIEITLF